MEAIDRGDADGVRALLAAGANVKVADPDGVTLVMRAAAAGNAETVRLLLAAGADPTARDRHGRNAADRARDGLAAGAAEAVRSDPADADGRIGKFAVRSSQFTVWFTVSEFTVLRFTVRSLRVSRWPSWWRCQASWVRWNRNSDQVRIVAMGDSTTAGTPAFKSPREAPPKGSGDETSQYAYWLMKAHPDWEVVNQGINAQRSDVIAARFEEDVVAKKPAVVVIIAGVNDVYQGRPAQHVKDQLAAMYKRAHDAGIRVVAGTIIPYNTATADQNARMRDDQRLDPHPGARRPRRHRRRHPRRRRRAGQPDKLASSPDGLHPDAAGYRKMADAIAPPSSRPCVQRSADLRRSAVHAARRSIAGRGASATGREAIAACPATFRSESLRRPEKCVEGICR